ncbi:endonuclease/exonuclease/phosphatase family protein [Gemmobacter sp.]|uniref:endonuclease/exonuclease/phosphatase family protein n=1 Tax=Gemmobacter sp. TaxID=1898957 RepID=UPI002AFEEC87|nr:endonuclease/exonuclease/phosphatase family protein [Gemmobacter sp.]
MKPARNRIANGYADSLRNIVVRSAAPVPAAARTADGSLRIASYNIHKCVGTDGRFDPDRIRHVIRELSADVVALQEVDQRFGDRAGLLDLPRLEAETGLVPVPTNGHPRAHGWHGNLVLVRGARVQNVEQLALPGLEPRGAVIADLDFGPGRAARVIGTHFGLLRRSRHRQASLLASYLRTSDRGAVLMGDLNEWRIDRGSPLARYLDDHGETNADAPPSFPARMPLLPLDRIIASAPGALGGVRVHHSPLARVASDHLPICADWSPAPA